jgi:hypothetical protein
MFCSNQLGNNRQMDLSGTGIDVKLKERKKDEDINKCSIKSRRSMTSQSTLVSSKRGAQVNFQWI